MTSLGLKLMDFKVKAFNIARSLNSKQQDDYLETLIINIIESQSALGEDLDADSAKILNPRFAMTRYMGLWIKIHGSYDLAVNKTLKYYNKIKVDAFYNTAYNLVINNLGNPSFVESFESDVEGATDVVKSLTEIYRLSWRIMQCLIKDESIGFDDFRGEFMMEWERADELSQAA